MSEERELLVNLRNGKRAEVQLSDNAVAARAESIQFQPDPQEEARRAALDRLKARAEKDQVLADLLVVLGLAVADGA